jgi:outer membrane protein
MKPFSKKMFLLPAFLWLALLPLKAQDQLNQPFTLEECISYAVENNVRVKNERLNQGIAKAQVGEIFAQGLPQINASGNLTYNIQRQTNFLPGALAGQSGFIPVQFGTPYQSNASLSASQLIFNGSYFVGLRASKVFKELANKGVVKARIDVAEAVALAYYGVLVSEERLVLLQANLGRLDSLYRETQAMNEQGFAEAIDVQRLKVNLNNLETEYQNVQRSLAINLNALKFQMGLPLDQPIEIAERIQDFENLGQMEVSAFEYSDRIEYQQLNINRELTELDVKKTRSEYLPNLSAFFNYGYNAGRESFGDLFEPTILQETDEQGNVINERAVDTWNGFSSVGLNLNIPIFDGLLKANTIRRKKLLTQQVENQIQNLESAIELEAEQARITLVNSLQSLENQQENRKLAEEVFRVAKIKYQEGVGSNLEVVEAENALKSAETNYFISLYDALVARVAYQKATGALLQN